MQLQQVGVRLKRTRMKEQEGFRMFRFMQPLAGKAGEPSVFEPTSEFRGRRPEPWAGGMPASSAVVSMQPHPVLLPTARNAAVLPVLVAAAAMVSSPHAREQTESGTGRRMPNRGGIIKPLRTGEPFDQRLRTGPTGPSLSGRRETERVTLAGPVLVVKLQSGRASAEYTRPVEVPATGPRKTNSAELSAMCIISGSEAAWAGRLPFRIQLFVHRVARDPWLHRPAPSQAPCVERQCTGQCGD